MLYLASFFETFAKTAKMILNFDWLSGVSVGAARWIFLSLFIAIGIVVCLIPSDYIFEGVKERTWWRDLRLWGLATLASIFATYYIF